MLLEDNRRKKKRKKIFSLLFLFSSTMERCALSLLGRCDKEASSGRYANESWCVTAKLTEEEKAKIEFKPLCKNHANRPERVTPEFQTPPLKRSKSDPPATPSSQKISSSQPASFPITPPNSGGEKKCNGINNPDLEEFVQYKFGFTYPDDEGYPWGEKLKTWPTYRARMCTGVARSKGADRCEECHRLYKAMVSAKARHENSEEAGTQKYTPISSLKVSPYVRDMIAKFREENKPAPEPEPVNNDTDDLDIEVSLPPPSYNETLTPSSCL